MTETDRELLEMAAKAHDNLLYVEDQGWIHVLPDGSRGAWWQPLADDGDALRLAVKLDIDLMNSTNLDKPGQSVTYPINGDFEGLTEWYSGDGKQAATRRAIVRAAAEIGKTGGGE